MSVSAYTLFSSSSGNCTYISDGKTHFLIDAGGSLKRIKEALESLGASVSNISAVFVTHEHKDHTAAIPLLYKNFRTQIHAQKDTAELINSANIIPHDDFYEANIGDFTVKSFTTSHDSVCCLGYRIEHKSGVMIGTATDTGFVTQPTKAALRGCSYVILESNYDEKMLIRGPYPDYLKKRILSKTGHLCNSDAADFLPYLYENGTKKVLLSHISPENNTKEAAMQSALRIKKLYGLSNLEIDCADKNEVVKLL